jgi:hypothetical protein
VFEWRAHFWEYQKYIFNSALRIAVTEADIDSLESRFLTDRDVCALNGLKHVMDLWKQSFRTTLYSEIYLPDGCQKQLDVHQKDSRMAV